MAILTQMAWWILTIGMALMIIALPILLIILIIGYYKRKDWPNTIFYTLFTLVLSALAFLMINGAVNDEFSAQEIKKDVQKLYQNLGLRSK